jgi:hypothetical protein
MPVVRLSAAEYGGLVVPKAITAEVGRTVVALAQSGADAELLPPDTLINITPPQWTHTDNSSYVVKTVGTDPPEHCTVYELPHTPEEEIQIMESLGELTMPPKRHFIIPRPEQAAFMLASQVTYEDGGDIQVAEDLTRLYEVIVALSAPILTRMAAITSPFWRYQK